MDLQSTTYITSDQDADCLITVRQAGAIFYLLWSPSRLDSAPHLLQDYSARLEELREDDTRNGFRLVRPFTALMDQLAPAGKQPPFSLHDYLYPPWFQLKATVADDRQTIMPVHDEGVDSPFCPPGLALYSKKMQSLDLGRWVSRCLPSREIELPADVDKHPLLHGPTKVIMKESQTECFLKGLGAGHAGSIGELTALRALAEATGCGSLVADARVCRLYGLVVDTLGPRRMEKRVVGMLLNYIRPKRRGILGTLQCVAYEEPSYVHLRRWADELENLLSDLQRAGCVWGDAKPENVLVDSDDNVWLIDFGGGYTPGWVDEEQQGTRSGDLGAMEKIRRWLEELATEGGRVG